MENIITVRYIDALYYTGSEFKYPNFYVHVALGRLIFEKGDFLIISFTDKDKFPERGLLIPKEAIIFNNNKKNIGNIEANRGSKLKKQDIGIYWKDIVYFDQGIIPIKPTKMYSEGELFLENPDVIVVKNPITVAVKDNNVKNHPKDNANFIAIPKVLIEKTDEFKRDKRKN